MALFGDTKQYGGGQTQKLTQGDPPQASDVEHFHTNADADVRPEALHHTLGGNPNQASPGNHNHDGGTSALLLDGIVLTGSKTDGTALNSVISALVRLGAKDQTT